MVAILSSSRQAPAVFIGWQDGFGSVPDFTLWNLTADIPGHPAGSTVSGATLQQAGFFLPENIGESPRHATGLPTAAACPASAVFLEVVSHPQGGWTHAEPVDATRSTKRCYRGWWPTRGAAQLALDTKFS